MERNFDYVIFGAGIYGLYAAKLLAEKGLKIALIEFDAQAFERASLINQARVHNGYHYPRSVSTAVKSAHYYERFNKDFSFAINKEFKKIYAISANDSLTNAEQFLKFCDHVNIPAEEINSKKYFNHGSVEAAFETAEYSYDAQIIKKWYLEQLKSYKNLEIFYNKRLSEIDSNESEYKLYFNEGLVIQTPKVLNATYASLNQIVKIFNYDLFNIKYEICEVILTEVNDVLNNVGITVMDGPFFSVMPFGQSGTHSLTSVGQTPHSTSYQKLPTFSCQKHVPNCSPDSLNNCNLCSEKPSTAWLRMHQLSKKYLVPSISIKYKKSLFAVKAIMNAAELDDSRPTIIKSFSEKPSFISVLSGKFNTVYDLEEVLK